MALPRPAKPKVLLADLRALFAERSPVQLIAGALALLIPAIIVTLFYLDAQTNIAPEAQVVYVQSWPADRTDAEILSQQRANAQVQNAIREERRRQFERLNNGMDDLGL